MRKKSFFVKSHKNDIYIELQYPKKTPAPAIIVAHGLRSYFPGFLDMFCKAFREAGYIAIKFHFVGTGKSSGKFENKSTTEMLQNFKDVLKFVKNQPEVREIGVMARSNAASLAILHGPDHAIRAYTLLAPPVYYSVEMGKFIHEAKIKGNFFYHKSFKRRHTKGDGRLPLRYIDNLKQYDAALLRNVRKIKRAIYFQSTKDEAVTIAEGHFDYLKKHLPQPRRIVLIDGGNHSYKGYKRYVVRQSLRWFKKFLPPK